MTTNHQPTFTPLQLFTTTVDAIKRVYRMGCYERPERVYVVHNSRVSSRDPVYTSRTPMSEDEHTEYYTTRMPWVYLTTKFEVHPCVAKALRDGYMPTSITSLVFEWPHVSTGDALKLAYTRDDRALKDDRQTVTAIGKYLRRHFPQLADHTIRDLTASYTADECYIVNTREEIIWGIEAGPRSCMQSGYQSIPFSHTDDYEALCAWRKDPDNTDLYDEVPWEKHPYAVYAPELGWSMALRKHEGNIDGRALLWTDPRHPHFKTFVRSYRRASSDGAMSHADDMLEQWLIGQGYTKARGWSYGAEILSIPYEGDEDYCGPVVPYIDGGNNNLTDKGARLAFASQGELVGDNTDGTPTIEDVPDWHCEDCDDGFSDDDERYWVGPDEDHCVCSCCVGNYTWVQAGSHEYYIPNNDAVRVLDWRGHHDYCADPDDLPRSVIQLASGDYACRDDCVCIDDEWYLLTDSGVVELAEECPVSGECYALRDDARCDANGAWHSKHIDQTETE